MSQQRTRSVAQRLPCHRSAVSTRVVTVSAPRGSVVRACGCRRQPLALKGGVRFKISLTDNRDAIHDDVLDAFGIHGRVGVRRAIGDRHRIEHGDVGVGAGANPAAVAHLRHACLQPARRFDRHAADRVGERQDLCLAHVLAEDPRERAAGARVRRVVVRRRGRRRWRTSAAGPRFRFGGFPPCWNAK